MNEMKAKTVPEQPAYPNRFLKPDAAEVYVQKEYGPESFATAVWKMQEPQVRSALDEIRRQQPTGRHLDFACGTGRITRLAEEIFAEVDAMDISPVMVEKARTESRQAQFTVGNILESPDLCPGPYASITAFRFLLNVDPPLRCPVMTELNHRLAPDGTLIINLHGNRRSLRHPAILWKKWRRHTDPSGDAIMLNEMSRSEVEKCLENAGFRVEKVRGTGLLPQSFYRWPLQSLWRPLDRWLTGLAFLTPFCIDLLFICKKTDSPAK